MNDDPMLQQRALMQAMSRDESPSQDVQAPMEEMQCPQCRFQGPKESFEKTNSDMEFEAPADEETGEQVDNVLPQAKPQYRGGM
jgi:hypothetical protein